MTGNRVLMTGVTPKPGSFAEANGGRFKGMADPGEVYVDKKPGEQMNIAGKLLELIDTLRAMKLKNDELQQKEKPGSALWHHCETMDDHLFDALRLIGE